MRIDKKHVFEKIAKFIKAPLFSVVASLVLGFLVASIILLMSGYDPFKTMQALCMGLFGRPKFITNIVIKSVPLILTGISVSFAFKTGLFNIGAEGQFIVGSVAAAVVGLVINLPAYFQIPLLMAVGILAGGLWGMIAGFLKAKFAVHEVITTIMLNWIALYLSNYICMLPSLRKPNTNGTYQINTSGFTMILPNWKISKEGISFLKNNSFLNDVLLKTDLNVGILIAVVCAFIIWFVLYKTTKGYELRAVGLNDRSSKYAGMNVSKNIVYSMFVSGALCGLSGALTIMGTSPHCIYLLSVFEGNGFNALAVALIAKCSPIGCIFSGLLFSGLSYGGRFLQLQSGTPSEIINIVIGVIVFFIAISGFIPIIADKLYEKGVRK